MPASSLNLQVDPSCTVEELDREVRKSDRHQSLLPGVFLFYPRDLNSGVFSVYRTADIFSFSAFEDIGYLAFAALFFSKVAILADGSF